MNLSSIRPSPVLSVIRCTEPNDFSDKLLGVSRKFLPLGRDVEFVQAEVKLGSTRLAVIKRPPCVASNYLVGQDLTVLTLPMSDAIGMKVDGAPFAQPGVATHAFGWEHRTFQPEPMAFAGIFMPVSADCRGWPEQRDRLRLDPVRPENLQNIRSIVWDIMTIALHDPQRLARQPAVSGMQQSLIGSIDHAFATAPEAGLNQLTIGNYIGICRRVDEYVRSDSAKLLSSSEIAAAAGVTVRTLHNAMIAVNGMSLQKFMVLNRLWSVRAALLRAAPGDLVKTVALNHGFWHLGRFSQTYLACFGESPSQSLARAQQ